MPGLMHIVFERNNIPDRIRYNPSRDIAHCYKDILISAERVTLDCAWKELNEYLRYRGIEEEELGEAWVALAKFFNRGMENFDETAHQALEESGWFDTPMANVAVCAAIGRIMLPTMYHAMQEVLDPNVEQPMKGHELAERAQALEAYMRQPRWLRRFRGWLRRKISGFRL